MKRSVCLLLALVAAVVLAGCGKGDPTVAKIRRGTKVIEACAYKDNKDIKTVVIPDSVTTIGAEPSATATASNRWSFRIP